MIDYRVGLADRRPRVGVFKNMASVDDMAHDMRVSYEREDWESVAFYASRLVRLSKEIVIYSYLLRDREYDFPDTCFVGWGDTDWSFLADVRQNPSKTRLVKRLIDEMGNGVVQLDEEEPAPDQT